MSNTVFPRAVAALLIVAAFTVHAASASDGERMIFGRDIAPIFATHCFGCHGPDAAKRKGDLRLDDLKNAIARSPTKVTLINPGNARRSKLLRVTIRPRSRWEREDRSSPAAMAG